MNAAVILASGVGNRFNDPVPKQYHLIKGRPVIEYAISACLDSKLADEVIVVARREYLEQLSQKYGVTTVEGGQERNISFRNAIDYIKQNYSHCEKVVVVDAVNPLVTSAMIDKFFNYLEEYDIALTTSRIPTSLGCYDTERVDRSRFYSIQNPQAYKYEMLYEYFDADSAYTVIAHQMPEDSKIKLCWDFKDYAKIIYPHDIPIVEALLDYRDTKKKFDCHKNDIALRFLSDLRKSWPKETKEWEKKLNQLVSELFGKWSISEYRVNPASWKGLVIEGISDLYGEVVLKITPPFIGLYERNLHVMKRLPSNLMATLYDYDDKRRAILMERVIPGDYAGFDNHKDLIIAFFKRLYKEVDGLVTAEDRSIIPSFRDEIIKRTKIAKSLDFENLKVLGLMNKALKLYDQLSQKGERLIHGDLHRGNILLGDNELFAIDPWAFIAVPEMDIACFAAYSLRDKSKAERLNHLSELHSAFKEIVEPRDLDKALFIEMCVLLVGAAFGKNDAYSSAKLWLDLIEDVLPELKL